MKQRRKFSVAGTGRRLLEIGKDVLIVFLVLVNVTLAIMCLPTKTLTQTKWLAGALRPFAGLFGLNEAELTYTAPATGSAFIGAAQPIAVTLSTEAGRQSAQYDFTALDTLYGQYGGLLAQALESAEAPLACPEAEFYNALRAPGAAFCFPGNISPAVLGAWLNVRAPEGADAQWYLLALEGETARLYLLGDGCYRAQTALSAETLAAELSAAVPDGSFFAFESDGAPYRALDPLSLISASSAAVCTGLGTNPCDARFISALATRIGINPYGDARFVGSDGITPQGLFDVAFLSGIPNTEIYSPATFSELDGAIDLAVQSGDKKIFAIRYPRGGESKLSDIDDNCEELLNWRLFEGKNGLGENGKKTGPLIITYGRITKEAAAAQRELEKNGITADILKLTKIHPIPTDAIKTALEYENIFFFEEALSSGGIGEHFLNKLNTYGYGGRFTLTAVSDCFVQAAPVKSCLKRFSLDCDGMVKIITEQINGQLHET